MNSARESSQIIPLGSTIRTMQPHSFSDEAAQILQGEAAWESRIEYAPKVISGPVDDPEQKGVWERILQDGEYGLIPIENSSPSQGVVWRHLELFRDAKVRILGEVNLNVEMCSGVKAGTIRDQITRVVSHPAGLGQCSEYISTFGGGVELCEESNTAQSAMEVATRSPLDSVALSSRAALEANALQILDTDVADLKGTSNITQFLLVHRNGDHEIFDPEKEHHAAIIRPSNTDQIGVLRDILGVIKNARVDLRSLHSLKDADHNQDQFFLEMERRGDPKELEILARQLEEYKHLFQEFHWLGSWDFSTYSKDGWQNVMYPQEPRVSGSRLDPDCMLHYLNFRPKNRLGALHDVASMISASRVNIVTIDSATRGQKRYNFSLLVESSQSSRSQFELLMDQMEDSSLIEQVTWGESTLYM